MGNMRRARNRKSQMEIMGLMVVVILLIVGVLFAIKFVVLKKPPQVRQTFSRTQMASNTGLALMASSTANCSGTAVKDLLIDCAEWPEAGGTITCDDGTMACDYVNRTMMYILNQTLDSWQVKYYFAADTSKSKDPEDQLFYFSNRGCRKGLPGESESFFLPTSRGIMTLKIFVCE